MALADDIRYLCDIEELKTHKALYAKLVDDCTQRGMAAATELAELFAEDALCDFGELFDLILTGREAIRSHYGTVVPKSRAWMLHSVSNPIIEIAGDSAKASWTFYAMSTGHDAPNEAPRVSYGRYQDEYVRTASGWKQSKLKLFNETRNWGSDQRP